MQPPTSPRRQAMRRYPALGFLVIAAVLAVTLPSALTTPNAGPPTLAEFAPVPGQGQNAGGNLGRLGSGSSGELGFGSGEGGTGSLPPIDPAQPASTFKRCVGNPPRQTEDPLSPPCVASFEGNNFGATTRGVTRDEIVIVIHWNGCPAGATCTNFTDYSGGVSPEEPVTDQIGKVYARYFADRYQTYKRRPHFYGYYQSAPGDSAERFRNDVVQIDEELKPFAVIPTSGNGTALLAKEAANRGIVVAPYESFEREFYRKVAPRLFSFAPDLQDNARIAANYACRRLVRRPAKYSGNVLDQEKTRALGLMYTSSPEEPTSAPLARMLINELKRQCNEPVHEVLVAGTGRETWDQYPLALAEMRDAGVTTVIPITKGGDPLIYLKAADTIAWYPEWFFPRQGRAPDDTTSAQLYPPQVWSHAFGLSFDYRRARIEDQPWFVAYKDACSSCQVPRGYFPNRAYETLSLLFYGIQAAGPRLTADTLDRGLHAIPARPSKSPYVPATYFHAGNYSWVKDAKEMWWDPAGSPPGQGGAGCYRLPRGGKRFRINEWPRGDDGLFDRTADQPCQGSSQIT